MFPLLKSESYFEFYVCSYVQFYPCYYASVKVIYASHDYCNP